MMFCPGHSFIVEDDVDVAQSAVHARNRLCGSDIDNDKIAAAKTVIRTDGHDLEWKVPVLMTQGDAPA